MSIGENIKKVRKDNKLTQKQLAELIDKKERTIQKYEKGDIIPPIDVLNKICSELGITLTELIEGKKTLTKELCNYILISSFYPDSDEKDFCNIFGIDFDLFNKCMNSDEELPEDILIKIVERGFEDNSSDFLKFFQDNYELISNYKELKRFCLIKKGAAQHTMLRDAQIKVFLKNITPKLQKYLDLKPSDKTILNKISDLIDYEIYKIENNKEGE